MEPIVPKIYLSRSNLETLLNKLDNPNSLKTIVKYRNEEDPFVNTLDTVMIIAVEDYELYTTRKRGTMLEDLK